MASSGILRSVALVRNDVSEEHSASIIKVTRIGERGTTLAVSRLLVTAIVVPSSPIIVTLMKEAIRSSGTSVLTRAMRCNISKDAILLSCSIFEFRIFKLIIAAEHNLLSKI
jgi:hypothetical protein